MNKGADDGIRAYWLLQILRIICPTVSVCLPGVCLHDVCKKPLSDIDVTWVSIGVNNNNNNNKCIGDDTKAALVKA